MKKLNKMPLKGWLLILVFVVLLGCMAGCSGESQVQEILATEEYSYVNPDETKAETDSGIVIDGILDEEAYSNSKWLYLNNNDGGNDVHIAMTSYYGEKGIYFVYDVTESVPIYVNLDRATYMNSCIEMYLVAPYATGMQENDVFEIDLLPTGDMLFKRNNGKGGYINVASTNDIMARLGTTTKGGPVNTRECYGYCMELFIPWDYLQWLKLDVEAIRDSYVYVNPAHITSYNHNGTDTSLDRLWYHYVQQTGASFSNVSRFFRFNGTGVMGGVPIDLQPGEHYSVTGASNVIPGMNAVVNITPEEGYALTSVLINGQEHIQNVNFNQDGSVTLKLLGEQDAMSVAAKAEAVTEGVKTLSGKIILNNINKDSMKDLVTSYIGPKGEKPLTVDANGNFELKDMEPGYYTLKAEKKGYQSVSRRIYLNRDFYTELTLEFDYFRVTQGSSFILDKQNDGILYKKEGSGQVLSNTSYNQFTFRANLKYDPNLAKLGTADEYTQQRTGLQVRFSNGKSWHIDLLKEKGKYILQYAKISGNNSLTNWQTIHTLDAKQIARYTGKDGIRLSIMRQGNYAAIWLDNELIKIEILDEKYNSYSAQLGVESWAANRDMLEIPFSVSNYSAVNVKASPFLAHAKSWNISGQYQGKVHKQGTEGVYTRLESVLVTDDVTTVAKDLTPDAKDYSLAYTFKFSNGEQLSIRLHHTDADGAYRIQTMDGSTVVPAWKVGYTLTEEQTEKILTGGVEYRVKLADNTAYVYVDGEEVCTYDISKVIASGQPSNIDKATAKVSFALDGNYGRTTELPFKIADKSNDVMIVVDSVMHGNVSVDKASCKMGDTVKLTLNGEIGYYYTNVLVNGEKIEPAWDGTYSFKATTNIYIITAEFAPGWFLENGESSWNVLKQNQGILKLESHKTGDSGWLSANVDGNDISTTIRDASPAAKNFSMIYHFDFDNGENLRLRLHHTDSDGKYRIQVMDGSTLSEQKDLYTLTAAEEKKIKGDGLKFRVLIEGTEAKVYLEDQQVCVMDLSKVVASGADSGVADAAIRVKLRMDGNLKQTMQIPFKLMDSSRRVTVLMDAMAGGKVTTDEANYQLGDVIKLKITPDAGYSQKLFVNGEPVLLDWKTNTYSFVATEEVYNITGSFEPSLNAVAKDTKRWDTANQAHGIFNAYYPNNDDAWLLEIKGEYRSISVKAKNYLSGEDGKGAEGFAVNLGFKLSNGKEYIFRIIREKGKYYCQRFGINGNDWTKSELDAAAIAAICGDGADFKLQRSGSNALSVSVNGVVYDTYTVDGATADTKVTKVIVGHYGNKGEKIALPFVLKMPTDAPDVQLNIAEMTGGTVTSALSQYQVGDTVTLTVAPEEGYSQKLYINGQPLLLGWKSNTYSFEATEEVYNITGSFEPSLNATPKDANRWDVANQAHGIFNAYYPNNDDAWLLDVNGEYRSISAKAKNYLAGEDGNGGEGFALNLGVRFDNGKEYIFRIIRQNSKYYCQRFGINGSDWTKKELDAAAIAAICGDGVDFKLERVGANTLLLSVNGEVYDTYVVSGLTADNKVTKVIMGHYGNRGAKIEIPFELKAPSAMTEVQLDIVETTGGTIFAEQEGNTVILIVTPNEGCYLKNLTVEKDGQSVDIGSIQSTGGRYSFVAEAGIYSVNAEFEEPPFRVVKGNWDLSDQLNGNLTITSQADGTTVITNGKNYKEFTVKVKDHTPSKNPDGSLKRGNFAAQIYFIFDNGRQYQVRIHNTDADGNYKLQNMGEGSSLTGWKWQADLTAAQKDKLINGDGVEFTVKLSGPNAELWVDGSLMKTVALGAEYDGKTAQVKLCMNGNTGVQNMQIPFVLKTPEDAYKIQFNVAAMTNGTVTADRESYNLGDTVTLTVNPAANFSQKLYINGQPLLLGFNATTYSFVATEEIYNITGSFVPSVSVTAGNRWFAGNQAHGILNAYYPSNNDAWRMDINGEYSALAIMAKNFKAQEDTMEGVAAEGFSAVISLKIGNTRYGFRLINKSVNGAPQYQYSRYGGEGATGWGGKCVLDDKVPGATAKLNGEGIEFKVTRISADTLQITLDGVVLDTYTISGLTYADKVTAATIYHYGNRGEQVVIPYELQNIESSTP